MLTPKISGGGDEVVIVSNELNKTHVNESSTDDDFQSLDSLENLSPKYRKQHPQLQRSGSGQIARKLDESEVLIVSPVFIGEEDQEDQRQEQDDFINDELHLGESIMNNLFYLMIVWKLKATDENTSVCLCNHNATYQTLSVLRCHDQGVYYL